MTRNRAWTASVVSREIGQNLRADWMWNLATLVLAFATVVFLLVSDLNAISTSITTERELTDAGKYVVVVRTLDLSDGPAVPAQRCTNLSQLEHVIAVGGLSNLGIASIPSHPGHSFRVYGGVGGIRRVLDPEKPGAGGDAVATHLSRQLGVRSGDEVLMAVASGPQRDTPGTVQVFNPTRHELGDGMWLVGQHAQVVDECWVEFEREAFEHGLAIVRSSFIADRNTTISPLIADDDLVSNPQEQFDSRALRNNYWLIGALLGAPSALGIWLQRSRGGLYRSFGASKLRTAVMIAARAVWVAAFASADAWVTVRIWFEESDRIAGIDGWAVATRGFLLSWTTAFLLIVVASFAAAHGDITKQLKDRV